MMELDIGKDNKVKRNGRKPFDDFLLPSTLLFPMFISPFSYTFDSSPSSKKVFHLTSSLLVSSEKRN